MKSALATLTLCLASQIVAQGDFLFTTFRDETTPMLLDNVRFPYPSRHGSVLPITKAEREGLASAMGAK